MIFFSLPRYEPQVRNACRNILPVPVTLLPCYPATLLDLMLKEELQDYDIKKEEVRVFASVGAGMNINAVTYKM